MRLPRLGPGPVFIYEWLAITRRWQLYALRSLLVGSILVGITFIWVSEASHLRATDAQTVSISDAARVGQSLYRVIAVIELSLILLAAPATTAGAICLDKARGTLDHMLTTDLSNTEIVLGKLAVRLIPVVSLIACVLPVTALISLLGGIDLSVLIGSVLSFLGSAILCCSLALVLSVWGKKTHEVLTLTYLLVIFWLLGPTVFMMIASTFFSAHFDANPGTFMELWRKTMLSNPYFLLFGSEWRTGNIDLKIHWIFLAACLSISTCLIALATFRIRHVALSQKANIGLRKQTRWPFVTRLGSFGKLIRYHPRIWAITRRFGPSLDANPVLWREWHRAQPSPMLHIARVLYTSLGAIWVAAALNSRSAETIPLMIAFQVSLGLLLLSVSAATSLAEERVRGSLDVLLSTPMSTRSILVGKWWGSFRQIRAPLFWAAVLGLPLLTKGPFLNYLLMLCLICVHGAVIASLGLALATWNSSLGRAIAICVSTYILFSVGWIVILTPLVASGSQLILLLRLGSPPVGAYAAAASISDRTGSLDNELAFVSLGVPIWVLILLSVAGLLFAKTVKSFDHRLGRISEAGQNPFSHSEA